MVKNNSQPTNKMGCYINFGQPDYFVGSLTRANRYGANCCMVYLGNPRSCTINELSDEIICQFHQLAKEIHWKTSDVIVHAPYATNPSSCNENLRQLSQITLIKLVNTCQKAQIDKIVFHPGSNCQQEVGLKQLIHTIQTVIDATASTNVNLCLETMAGKGHEMCCGFAQIGSVLEQIKTSRLGVCLDTCHLHDSGINLQNVDQVLQEIQKHFSVSRIKVIHLNDSKNICGSRKDRHANIGQGHIGLATLKKWANHPKFYAICKILETPKGQNDFLYQTELSCLKEN